MLQSWSRLRKVVCDGVVAEPSELSKIMCGDACVAEPSGLSKEKCGGA